MNKQTRNILIGVGVLAVIGLGVFMYSRRKKAAEQAAPQQTSEGGIAQVASSLVDKLARNPEIQKQKLENKRLKGATRQAKLLKRGKITIEDLQNIQNVKTQA